MIWKKKSTANGPAARVCVCVGVCQSKRWEKGTKEIQPGWTQ
jgi:hypothetical protein